MLRFPESANKLRITCPECKTTFEHKLGQADEPYVTTENLVAIQAISRYEWRLEQKRNQEKQLQQQRIDQREKEKREQTTQEEQRRKEDRWNSIFAFFFVVGVPIALLGLANGC